MPLTGMRTNWGFSGRIRAQRGTLIGLGAGRSGMYKVGIIGGTGYTGVELMRLLAAHPRVELVTVTSRGNAGMPVAEMFPGLRGIVDLTFSDPDISELAECDIVFFATPHGTAMQAVPELLERGVWVIVFGRDFRLVVATDLCVR